MWRSPRKRFGHGTVTRINPSTALQKTKFSQSDLQSGWQSLSVTTATSLRIKTPSYVQREKEHFQIDLCDFKEILKSLLSLCITLWLVKSQLPCKIRFKILNLLWFWWKHTHIIPKRMQLIFVIIFYTLCHIDQVLRRKLLGTQIKQKKPKSNSADWCGAAKTFKSRAV